MSTSLLYHAFGIRGYRYIRTDYRGGEVFFTIGQDLETCHCSAGGAGAVRPRGRVERRFRAQPIGRRPTTIVRLVPRVECLAWGVVRQVEIAFADPRRGYTRSFGRFAPERSRRMTIRDVASHLGGGRDVVKDIPGRDLTRRFARPRLKDIAVMAIDEIAVAQGHRYLTLVMDLDSGAVKCVGDGKGADALEPFWKRLRPSGARIEAVARDLSGGYRSAVRAHLADAVIVFDPFHVVKRFNDKLSDLRRALYREAIDVPHKEVLKGTRWSLLKDAEDLDPKKDDKSRLTEALKLNEPLATADSLKEDLRRFWEQPGKRFATTFLDGGIRRAETSGVQILQQMAETRAAHRSGLLAYYDAMISSGPLEGTNHKIKTMKRPAYGFRDPESFKLKILAIHESRYALVG